MTMRLKLRARSGAEVQAAQRHLAAVEVHPPADGVGDGAGLLEDLLLHEVAELALGGRDRVIGDVVDLGRHRLAGQGLELHALARHHGHLAVLQEDHAPGVLQDGGDVGGDEGLAVAQADGHAAGVAQPGDHQPIGLAAGHGHDGAGPCAGGPWSVRTASASPPAAL